MDQKEIRELALLMKEMGLTSLEYKGGGSSIKLGMATGVTNAEAAPAANVTPPPQVERRKGPAPAPAEVVTIKSPVVGVVYMAESPSKEPYASLGDTVRAGEVLCLIDAMKMMNEITAECDGVISEICVKDQQVVEFNQPLFRIKKS